MHDKTAQISRLSRCAVVPVVTIPSVASAVPLAEALLKGGLDVIEVTLRSDCALEAISEIVRSGLGICVGAGTILTPKDVDAAQMAGAEFLVSPGMTSRLVAPLREFEGLVLPGISTVSEALCRLEEGFTVQKLFPAELSGGAAFLQAIGAPVPGIRFMPTGGVHLGNLPAYLALPNVVAAGGSWLAPADLVVTGQFAEITRRALEATELVTRIRSGANE